MQSAENGFKKHNLIPISKKYIKVRQPLPSLQEKENCQYSTILSLNKKKIRFMYPPHQRFYGKHWNSSEKENEHVIG